MAFSTYISRLYRDVSGTVIGGVETVTSDLASDVDVSIPATTTNAEVDWSIVRANLKGLCLYAASALTIKTNGTGSAGSITGSAVNAGGSGYALADTGTIAGGTAGTYIVTGVSGSGAVTAYTVTAGGSAYAVGSHATATGGGQAGSGT